MGDYYVELNDYGLAYVSARSALYLGLCQQAHTFRVVAVFFFFVALLFDTQVYTKCCPRLSL